MVSELFYDDDWPEVIKLFSCSTQLSIKLQLLIKTKMMKKIGISCF